MALNRNYLQWLFSGAGTYGPLEVGGAAAAWELGLRPSRLYGTSAGAIIAALLALGLKPAQIRKIMNDASFAHLIPINWWLFYFRKYAASNANVGAWLQEITQNKLMKDCQIPLSLVTTDVVTGQSKAWTTEADPTMPVCEAVLSSMSIPLVFPFYQDRYCDGGLRDNLATNLLVPSEKALVFKVAEPLGAEPLGGLVEEVVRLFNITLAASESALTTLGQKEGATLIPLPASGFGFLDTTMSRSDKEVLYQRGFMSAMEVLQ